MSEAYNPAAIKEEALNLLKKNNNLPDEARTLYHATILDWTDFFMEVFPEEANERSKDAWDMVDKIAQLWIDLATLLASLRQYKQAVQVFEDALKDAVSNSTAKTFIAFAKYYIDREKVATAQKVFIRALTSQLIQSQVDQVWISFAATMQSAGMGDLSIKDLFEAVSQQLEGSGGAPLSAPGAHLIEVKEEPVPSSSSSSSSSTASGPSQGEAEVKMEVQHPMVLPSVEDIETTGSDGGMDLVAVESKDDDNNEGLEVQEEEVEAYEPVDLNNLLPDQTPLELLAGFKNKPPLLFVAPNQVSLFIFHFSSTSQKLSDAIIF